VGDQLDDARPIIDCNLLSDEDTLGEVRNEVRFGFRPETCGNKVRDFGDHQDRDEECAAELLQQFARFAVVAIVRVEGGVERTGVNEQGYRENSCRRISSTRSETSDAPLCQERPPARRRRPRTLRCSSMASRVTVEMVTLRRAASWRRRTSSSSGSLMVVRLMGMPAYHIKWVLATQHCCTTWLGLGEVEDLSAAEELSAFGAADGHRLSAPARKPGPSGEVLARPSGKSSCLSPRSGPSPPHGSIPQHSGAGRYEYIAIYRSARLTISQRT